MPLPPLNFLQPVMQHDLSNLGNIFGNYYKGYEQARTPQRLAQEELSRSLFNEIQKVDLRYKPQKYESDIAHSNAQTGLTREQAKYYPQKAASEIDLNKAHAQHYRTPPAEKISELGQLLYERNRLAQNPKDNAASISMYDQAIKRKAEGTPGLELEVSPSGAISFSQGGTSSSRNNHGLQVKTDEKGNTTTYTAPTVSSTNQLQQRQVAAKELEFASPNVEMPYQGSGSNLQLKNDMDLYQTSKDPEARERLVQAATSHLMTPDIAAWQLQSLGIPLTVPALQEQKKKITTGWPESTTWFIDNAPKEIIAEAKKRQNQLIKDTKEIASNEFAQGFPIEMQNQNPAMPQGEQAQERIGLQDVIYKLNSRFPQAGPFTEEKIISTMKKHGFNTAQELLDYIEQGSNNGG